MFKRSSTTPLLVFAAGMAAGWVAKQLFETPEVQERTKALRLTADDWRQRLADSDEAERVKEIFGKVSREATEMYQDAKADLVDQLETLQGSLNDLDKSKYLEIVTEIVAGIQKDRELPEDQVKKLTRALNSDWQKVSDQMMDSGKGRHRLAARNRKEW